MQSLQRVFGEIGGLSVPVDVLKFDPETFQAILRVPAENYFKLRSSLALIREFQGQPCRFNIHGVSPVLITLSRSVETCQ